MVRPGSLTLVPLALVVVMASCSGRATDRPAQASTTTWYSIAEKAELIVACIQERGFQAEVYEIGVLLHYGGQQEAAERAHAECSEEIDARYPDPPRLSDREMYDALLEAAECLRAEGIAVSDPPTFEAWVDSRNPPMSEVVVNPPWSPHAEIPVDADFWALHRKCPQPGLGLTPEGGEAP